MQFSPLLVDKYINYMKRKHAVAVSRDEAQQDLMLLAEFHESTMRESHRYRERSGDRPEGGLT
jgi:hypothetical protein